MGKRILSVIVMFVLVVGFSMQAVKVSATEATISIEWVPYSGKFAVDSLNGVSAMYGSSSYSCTEYAVRYYRQVYGVSLQGSYMNQVPRSGTAGYRFVKTTNPQPGDIVFSSAAQRGKGYAHTAVVKSYSGGVITLIEQNWGWNGKAAKNRKVNVQSSYHTVWHLESTNGNSVSKNVETSEKAEKIEKTEKVETTKKTESVTKAETTASKKAVKPEETQKVKVEEEDPAEIEKQEKIKEVTKSVEDLIDICMLIASK